MAATPVTLLPPTELQRQLTQFALDNPPVVTLARNIAGLTFDAVISESHVSELQVTENPIETGVAIADHCFMRPLRVTINAVVSDLKLPSASNIYDGSPSGRVRRAYEMLQQLQTDLAGNVSQPFSVATGLRTYDNMVVVSLSATQDVTTARLLAFTAELVQVITVSTAYAAYTPPKPMPRKPTHQAAKPKEQGKQQPAPVVETKRASLLDGALNRASGGRWSGFQRGLGVPSTSPAPQYARPSARYF